MQLPKPFKKYLKFERPKTSVLILGGLILLIELIVFTYLSYPPSILYDLRKGTETLLISLNNTHKGKAQIYLHESTRLQGHLNMLLKEKNFHPPEVKAVAEQLMDQQQQAIIQMDLAAQKGANIDDQVEKLCDNLIAQHRILKDAIVKTQKIATLPLEEYANLTKILLDESSGW